MGWYCSRRLPEELVMSVLAGMIASNTLTDDRLATFFMAARRVLKLEGCSMIRNSILRQIPYRCPHLVRLYQVLLPVQCTHTTDSQSIIVYLCSALWICQIACR